MKKFNLKQFAVLAVIVAAVVIIGSCRKNSGSTDLIIVPPPVPGIRALTFSALNSSTQDSLTGYSLHIKSPSGTSDQNVAGTSYTIKNPEAGVYTFTATLNGFIAATRDVIVVLPTKETASLLLNASVLLTKSAPSVAITAAMGGVVTVKEDVEQPAAPVIASVSVPANTVFTLADGSKPATVNISVTNLPTAAAAAPVEIVNGQQETALKEMDIVNNGLAVKKLDLQPQGLTFSKPMVISMYIGDMYPGMTVAEKTADQTGLVFDYKRQDGTVETVNPDHFSLNRDTIFFQISHFSDWQLSISYLKLVSTETWSPLQTVTSDCGAGIPSFSYSTSFQYTNSLFSLVLRLLVMNGYLLTTYVDNVNIPAVPGYTVTATWQTKLNKIDVTNTKNGQQVTFYLFKKESKTDKTYNICHNQGGGH